MAGAMDWGWQAQWECYSTQKLCSETWHKSVTWPTRSHGSASSLKADLQVPRQPLIVHYKAQTKGTVTRGGAGPVMHAKQRGCIKECCMESRCRPYFWPPGPVTVA